MIQALLNQNALVNFGYKSVMKHIATDRHVHCAYGGEELSRKNPATAEHIKPKYYGGACSDSNYLPVCEKHNGERGHIPLNEYVVSHPQIWENIKRAILELRNVVAPNFDGPSWAKNVKKAVETEAKKPLEINVFA